LTYEEGPVTSVRSIMQDRDARQSSAYLVILIRYCILIKQFRRTSRVCVVLRTTACSLAMTYAASGGALNSTHSAV